jgi:predicted phosphodiesterase
MIHDRPVRLSTPDCDAVIMAGDIDRAPLAIATARTLIGPDLPLIIIAGNHEAYGLRMPLSRTLRVVATDAWDDREAGRETHFLNDSSVILRLAGDDVQFAGATLWTDFALLGAPAEHALVAAQGMNDYIEIMEDGPDGIDHLTPEQTFIRHRKSRTFLVGALTQPHHGKLVVVTHHLPSIRSVPARFRADPISAAFASNCDDLLALGADLWVHGHTHDSHDYLAGRTRVICNPRGYMQGGRPENRQFDPGFVVEI